MLKHIKESDSGWNYETVAKIDQTSCEEEEKKISYNDIACSFNTFRNSAKMASSCAF